MCGAGVVRHVVCELRDLMGAVLHNGPTQRLQLNEAASMVLAPHVRMMINVCPTMFGAWVRIH